MEEKQEEWTTENALRVLNHPSVDSKLWADAVEWLMLYGPQEIKELLAQASGQATKNSFPELKTTGCTTDGEPCYTITDLAKSLNIPAEEAAKIISEKEKQHGIRQLFDKNETGKLQ
jgi:hypothetical protein